MRASGAGSGKPGARKTHRRVWAGRTLAVALAVIGCCLAAAPAGAVIVKLRGWKLSYLPVEPSRALEARLSKAPLTYHGGPVMSSNANYTVYWDPSGAPSYPSGYETGIDRYFEDLAADSGQDSNTDSVLIAVRRHGRRIGQL